jgi:hypothetical protein
VSAPQNVTISRLSLHPGALTEAQARRLAELVGLALGRIPARSADSVPVRAADSVAVAVPPQSGKTLEQIADTIARAIEDALRMDGAQ